MTESSELNEFNLEQLIHLKRKVTSQIEKIKAEKKILVWQVVTHRVICTNFPAEDYEKAIDYMISKTKEFAMDECDLVVKEGGPCSWGSNGVNLDIPYITPHWVPESEYLRDWVEGN